MGTNQRYGAASTDDVKWLKDRKVLMPEVGLIMQDYAPKKDRIKQAQASLPPELAQCICVREAADTSATKQEPESDTDEGSDVDIIPSAETDMEKALRMSRADVGGVAPVSDSQDPDMIEALRLSAEDSIARGGDPYDAAIVENLCELASCTPDVAITALRTAGGDEAIAAMSLFDESERLTHAEDHVGRAAAAGLASSSGLGGTSHNWGSGRIATGIMDCVIID